MRRRFSGRRGGYKRSRRRRPSVSNLWEVNPTYRKKCTIRGVAPLLVIGRQQDSNESYDSYKTQTTNFCPEQRFYVGVDQGVWWWPWNKKAQLQTGGWSVGCFSLHILWQEHAYHKNRWSASNCGFDLAKYRGTTLYLPQHADIDYIFFWDAEYKDMQHFLEHEELHPLCLITHPQAILVKSRERAGPRRTRKVYIPRPSWWPSGWSNMEDIAKTGLFVYYVVAVDLDHPWIGKYQNPTTKETGMWWDGKSWYDDWNEHVRNTDNNTSLAKRAAARDDKTNQTVRGGPFLLRQWKVEHEHYIYKQLTLFYKVYWTWGGRSLSIKKICDPTKPLGF